MSSLQGVTNPAAEPVASGLAPISGRKGSAEQTHRLLHRNDEHTVHEMLGHLLRRAYADMTSAVGVEQMAEEPFVGAAVPVDLPLRVRHVSSQATPMPTPQANCVRDSKL